MKWIGYTLFIAVLIVINQTVFGVTDLRGFVPDLLMLVTLAMVVSFDNWDFVYFAVLGGFWMDVIMGLPIGAHTIGLFLLSIFTLWLSAKWLLAAKGWRHFIGAIVIGSVIMHLWLWLYTAIIYSIGWHWTLIDSSVMLRTLIPNLIANLILAYPVFILIEYIASQVTRWFRAKSLT